jgi:hypothetical protein
MTFNQNELRRRKMKFANQHQDGPKNKRDERSKFVVIDDNHVRDADRIIEQTVKETQPSPLVREGNPNFGHDDVAVEQAGEHGDDDEWFLHDTEYDALGGSRPVDSFNGGDQGISSNPPLRFNPHYHSFPKPGQLFKTH